ncbi:oligosaccharide flippase family protein [Thioclava sp. IC9]|uniref:oligosaccharide flippase family protein n=1 Tax=Thioclava sp. IC9 TaxID=1973007 RepID=UPI0014133139|nr:oligosaccharide flippase family protein [Thioclava sp. IC9]
MLRTAILILSGNAATSALMLARNLVIARLIPVADYGVAATFAMVMAVIEMGSTLGLQQQIVQSKRGDDPAFQAALQGFQLLRGVIAAAALFVLAGPIADFLAIPEAASAYRWLALVPLLTAAQHFDIHRAQRRGHYRPMLLTGALPALAALIAIWPLSRLFDDWQVALWAILLHAALGVLVSHLMAERRYRLRLDRAEMRANLRFGAPLLANAALMYLVFQGDKIIVGRLAGMEALAVFAMGMTLTLTPTLIGAKSVQNLFLPKLSVAHGRADASAHRQLAGATFEGMFLTGSTLLLGTVLIGPFVVTALLGTKYASLLPLLIPFALMNALRAIKNGPSTVALSAGQTDNGFWGNLPRIAVLPLSCWALAQTGSVVPVIWLGVTGEAIGLGVALWRLSRVMALPQVGRAALTTALVLVAIPLITLAAPGTLLIWPIALLLIAAQLVALPHLRAYFGRPQIGTA